MTGPRTPQGSSSLFPFEYRVLPDDGWFLSGEKCKGFRVQYRKPGTRRWTRFILVHLATDAQIEQAILKHAGTS